MNNQGSDFLVSTEWLGNHLHDPNMKIFDCTTILKPDETGKLIAESGFDDWQQGHIESSNYIDLMNDLSVQEHRFRFMSPSLADVHETFMNYGITDDSEVILYDRSGNSWAARIWWMLRTIGFESAKILDGGYRKWTLEGRPVTKSSDSYPSGRLSFIPRPELFVDMETVLQSVEEGSTCLINALSEDQHLGRDQGRTYGRAGHIPTSINIPAGEMINSETHEYLQLEELQMIMNRKIPTDSSQIITYCGGGIAASNDAFVLSMLGYQNVAIYDASLSEWATDETLPMILSE